MQLSPVVSYQELPDISGLIPRSGQDTEFLNHLAAVLFQYGQLSRWGVFLAHRPSCVMEGEVLAEDFTGRGQIGLLHAIPIGAAGKSIETHFMLDPLGSVRVTRICRPKLILSGEWPN
jgi:hypothetical protein